MKKRTMQIVMTAALSLNIVSAFAGENNEKEIVNVVVTPDDIAVEVTPETDCGCPN